MREMPSTKFAVGDFIRGSNTTDDEHEYLVVEIQYEKKLYICKKIVGPTFSSTILVYMIDFHAEMYYEKVG